MSTPVPIRSASTILLLRDLPHFQVLMVRRQQMIDFMSGAMVFPGGKVETHDSDPRWQSVLSGWSEVPEHERAPRVAALREAFEETGVLIGADEFRPSGQATIEARRAIESGDLRFFDFLQESGIRLDMTSLTLFSRWLTPDIVPKRFDTFFFLARDPDGQEAISDGREIEEPEWIAPSRALDLATDGARTILFPTRMNLQLLAQSPTVQDAMSAARARQERVVSPRVEMRDGERFLCLDAEDGYGTVSERLALP